MFRVLFFRIHNFRSILDMKVNFAFAEKKAPPGFKESDIVFFAEPKKGERLIPAFALYGSNASGKSNVLMAMACSGLRHFRYRR